MTAPSPARPRVLVVHPGLSTFVQRDVDTLRDAFIVETWQWPGPTGLHHLAGLWKAVRRADVVLGWFAGMHAGVAVCMARRIGRPVAVIVGGYEVAAVPELGYGAFAHRHERWAAKQCLMRADQLLFVDQGLLDEARTRVPRLAPAEVLPTGYEVPDAVPTGDRVGVLTVAVVSDERRLRLKGLDLFLEAAARLPEVPFTVVGVAGRAADSLRARAPDNVNVHGFVAAADLEGHMRDASVFALLSMREGLPNVVCEAMAQGCVPVGSDVPGIQTAIGHDGVLVAREINAIVAGIRQALDAGDAAREQARSRIARRFPARARRDGLVGVLQRLASGQDPP